MRFLPFDFTLASISVLLLVLGALVLYGFGVGTDNPFFSSVFSRQMDHIAAGIAVALVFSRIDYRVYRVYANYLYFGAIGVLTILLVFGSTIRGTEGWISIGFVRIQPVEFVKIALVLFLASFIAHKKTRLYEISRLAVSCILTGILVGIVLLQPDFGSSMILFGTWFGMMLISGISRRYFLSILLLGAVACFGGWFLLEDYQKDRVMTVIYPEKDARGSGYNAIQSMVSVGSGGLFGKGIGQGTQSQLNFLPEKHTDFIFAATVESLGLVGAVFTLILYGAMLFRIRRIAEGAVDNFGYLVASGILVMLFIQMSVNIGMNMGVFPITGIPLPLLSYGGSSLVSTCISLGIVSNIAAVGRFSRRV